MEADGLGAARLPGTDLDDQQAEIIISLHREWLSTQDGGEIPTVAPPLLPCLMLSRWRRRATIKCLSCLSYSTPFRWSEASWHEHKLLGWQSADGFEKLRKQASTPSGLLARHLCIADAL